MAFLQGLSNVKLKKTKTKEYTADLRPVLSREENDKKVLSYNIEAWSDILEPCSFKTRYCELTLEDGKNLHAAYEVLVKNGEQLTPELAAWKENLTKRLEVPMKEFNAAEKGVFVKTSSRGPKDSPATQKKLEDLYMKALLASDDVNDENNQVRALLKAGHDCMRVYSAAEAIELLLSSGRIYADMKLALDHIDQWRESIVCREWKEIDFELEFRTFVYKGKMNAISQYTVSLYSKFVHKNSQLIVERIQDFFYKEVWPRVKDVYEDMVIDFGFSSQDLNEIYVIEINPYTVNSDGCLFGWGRDQKIFENGPFEFRCLKKPKRSIRPELEEQWLEKLDSMNKNLPERKEETG